MDRVSSLTRPFVLTNSVMGTLYRCLLACDGVSAGEQGGIWGHVVTSLGPRAGAPVQQCCRGGPRHQTQPEVQHCCQGCRGAFAACQGWEGQPQPGEHSDGISAKIRPPDLTDGKDGPATVDCTCKVR